MLLSSVDVGVADITGRDETRQCRLEGVGGDEQLVAMIASLMKRAIATPIMT